MSYLWLITQHARVMTYAYARVQTFLRVFILKKSTLNSYISQITWVGVLEIFQTYRASNKLKVKYGTFFSLNVVFMVKIWLKQNLADSINCNFTAKAGWRRSHDARKWRHRIKISWLFRKNIIGHNMLNLTHKFHDLSSRTFRVMINFVGWQTILHLLCDMQDICISHIVIVRPFLFLSV